VTLYNAHIPSAAPIIDREERIVSIDGGCVLKADGQLNALIIPGESSDNFSWAAYDGLPTAVALDPQQASTDSVNIRCGRSQLEFLAPGEELSLCRHVETGRVLPILNHYLQHKPEGLFCEDSTDYALPVTPGDKLSVVFSTKRGHLCKKDGATGWYYGRLEGHTI
jgi:protein phosphatase